MNTHAGIITDPKSADQRKVRIYAVLTAEKDAIAQFWNASSLVFSFKVMGNVGCRETAGAFLRHENEKWIEIESETLAPWERQRRKRVPSGGEKGRGDPRCHHKYFSLPLSSGSSQQVHTNPILHAAGLFLGLEAAFSPSLYNSWYCWTTLLSKNMCFPIVNTTLRRI